MSATTNSLWKSALLTIWGGKVEYTLYKKLHVVLQHLTQKCHYNQKLQWTEGRINRRTDIMHLMFEQFKHVLRTHHIYLYINEVVGVVGGGMAIGTSTYAMFFTRTCWPKLYPGHSHRSIDIHIRNRVWYMKELSFMPHAHSSVV